MPFLADEMLGMLKRKVCQGDAPTALSEAAQARTDLLDLGLDVPSWDDAAAGLEPPATDVGDDIFDRGWQGTHVHLSSATFASMYFCHFVTKHSKLYFCPNLEAQRVLGSKQSLPKKHCGCHHFCFKQGCVDDFGGLFHLEAVHVTLNVNNNWIATAIEQPHAICPSA